MNKRPLFSQLRNQKGMAMLIALFSLTLLIFLAAEVGYETQVEYVSSSQEVNRLKAYYAAKAGVEINLLRILIYKKALANFGSFLEGKESMLDPIWAFPYAWPPVVPDDLAGAEKDQINKSVKESSMKAQILATIESEGGKIDINDLGSPSKSLRESTKKQILKIFEGRFENDEDFRDKYDTAQIEELVNNLMDWVDEDEESKTSGDEKSLYKEDLADESIPPNKPFKTLKELKMVAGMTDELYEMLSSRVTIYGSKGINVNYSPADVLMALDPQITKEYAEKIIARREDQERGGPFKDEDDFLNFLGSGDISINTENFNEEGIPLLFGPEYNFRIKSTGQFANSTREITAIVYDIDQIKERLIKLLDEDDKKAQNPNGEEEPPKDPDKDNDQNPDQGSGKDSSDKKKKDKIKAPKGRPTIVYWEEI